MSSYAQRLATSLRNAYEAHDHVLFEQELQRMVRTMTYAGPTAAAGPVFAQGPECDRPPVGWRCTRGAGHEGPCAAWPATNDERLLPDGGAACG